MAIVGAGDYRYEVVDDWVKLPPDMELGMVSSVAADQLDRVYAFIRVADQPSMLILDRNGKYLNSWGTGIITDAHGLSFNAEGDIYLTDRNPHQVMKFSAWGQRMITLGTRDVAGEQTPFNRPSDVMEGPSGCFYVSDGYGNSCVHKYTNDGLILDSWGSPGNGEGQFNLPHGIWVDEHEHVYVCDRENNRIQIFDGDGNLLDIWNDFLRPTDIVMDAERDHLRVWHRAQVQYPHARRRAAGPLGRRGRRPSWEKRGPPTASASTPVATCTCAPQARRRFRSWCASPVRGFCWRDGPRVWPLCEARVV